MCSLFVYGTLRHPPVLERLLGRVPASEPARLEHFLAHDAERFVGGSRRGHHHPGGRA